MVNIRAGETSNRMVNFSHTPQSPLPFPSALYLSSYLMKFSSAKTDPTIYLPFSYFKETVFLEKKI